MSEPLLIVDDDAAFRSVWTRLLKAEGYAPIEAADADQAMNALRKHSSTRLVLLDLMIPPSNTAEAGAELLSRILAARAQTKVIIVSGSDELALALRLVDRGAHDFLQKPVDPDALLAVVRRAEARLALEDRVSELEHGLASEAALGGPLGQAPAFVAAVDLARKASSSAVPVLIGGASGTGKEVIARFLHTASPRCKSPFVAINCGAIQPALLESILFGHRKGAFTGAVADAKGLFVEANGGTLFLDEIGDLALDLQVKLLRALESGEVLPVGSTKPVSIDVRIVSATHRPLVEMIKAGTFRDDLYWRIRGLEIELPRLADRPGDATILAQHFLNQAHALVPGKVKARLSAEALSCIEAHDWPGNLRELRSEMQRAIILAAGRPEILACDLSPALQSHISSSQRGLANEPRTLEEKVFELEASEIARALAATSGNRSHAAASLGLSRQGLLNKMARYGIK